MVIVQTIKNILKIDRVGVRAGPSGPPTNPLNQPKFQKAKRRREMEYSGKDPRECKILFNWGEVLKGKIVCIEVDELGGKHKSYTIQVTSDIPENFKKIKKGHSE